MKTLDKYLNESIFDIKQNIRSIDKHIEERERFDNVFTITKITCSDFDILDVFDYNKIERYFKSSKFNIKNVAVEVVNEGKNDRRLNSLLKLIGNIKLTDILKDPHTYIYIKLGDILYKLIRHYIKTGNLKIFNVEVKRYDDNSFLILLTCNGHDISLLVEKNKTE